jgi:hypothetical protein
MSNAAEDFRAQGLKCLGLARESSCMPDRIRWLNMAQYWFTRADNQEHATPVAKPQDDDSRIKSFHHV